MKHPFAAAFAVLLVAFVAWRWKRLSMERRILCLVLAAGCAVFAADVVEFPNVEHFIEDVGSTLGKWTYLLVGVLAFLETGAFVGLIAPGESTIILGGVIAGQGEIDLFVLLAIVWASAVAGDTASFFLGRKLGRTFLLRHGPRFKITRERLEQVEGFFEKHGGKTVLIGRFVGIVRAVAPFIAGSSRMPFSRFIPYDVIGAGLWGTIFVLLGYIFWQSFDKVAEYAGRGALAFGTLIVAVVALVWLFRTLEDEEKRAALGARIEALEERGGILGRAVSALRRFAATVIAPAWRRVSGPVRFLWGRITPGQLGLELTTLLAVAAVGSFVFVGSAEAVADRALATFDPDAFDLADELRNDLLADVAEVLSFLGSGTYVGIVVLLTAGYLLARRSVVEAVALLGASTLTYAAVHIAKAVEDRPRPAGALIETEGSSFPSGHAAYAIAFVACAVALRHVLRNLAIRGALVVVAVVGAVAIGLSRVFLRAHYLSDVVGGWGLAAAIFAVCGMAALIVSFLRQNGRRS